MRIWFKVYKVKRDKLGAVEEMGTEGKVELSEAGGEERRKKGVERDGIRD